MHCISNIRLVESNKDSDIATKNFILIINTILKNITHLII